VNSRLAPDMQPFVYQVQSACDYVQGAAAWLSGQKAPKHEDNERTDDELRARIRKTVAFVESIHEDQNAGADARKVSLSWAPGKVINGEDYLLQVAIPNIYFHNAMACAILRYNGVDIGKNGLSRARELRSSLSNSTDRSGNHRPLPCSRPAGTRQMRKSIRAENRTFAAAPLLRRFAQRRADDPAAGRAPPSARIFMLRSTRKVMARLLSRSASRAAASASIDWS